MGPPESDLLSTPDALRRVLLESLPASSVFVFDLNMKLLIAEGEALRTHGYDPSVLVGKNLEDAVPKLAYDQLIPMYRLALAGEVNEFDLQATDGTRWYRIHTGPFKDEGRIVGGVSFSRDITDRKRSEEELRRVSESFETAFSKAPIGMALVGLDGTWMRINQALSDLIGYTQQEIAELTFQSLTHPDDLEEDLGLVNRLLNGEVDSYEMEKRYFRKNGEEIWALLTVSLVTNEDGTPRNFISQIQDISERKKFEEQLHKVASEDSLTGVANRRQLEIELEKQLERCRRYKESAALLMVDLDRFKSVNDRFGHAAGDAILRTVASDLTARMRINDVVARIGGDEFAVLMVAAEAESANAVATELMKHFDARKVNLDGKVLRCRASIGVGLMTGEEKTIDAVMLEADHAMYRIKQNRESKT